MAKISESMCFYSGVHMISVFPIVTYLKELCLELCLGYVSKCWFGLSRPAFLCISHSNNSYFTPAVQPWFHWFFQLVWRYQGPSTVWIPHSLAYARWRFLLKMTFFTKQCFIPANIQFMTFLKLALSNNMFTTRSAA